MFRTLLFTAPVLGAVIFVSSQESVAAPQIPLCLNFREIANLQNHRPGDPFKRSDWNRKIEEIENRIAIEGAEKYVNGSISLDVFFACASQIKEFGRFKLAFTKAIKDASIRKLQLTSLPHLRKVMDMIPNPGDLIVELKGHIYGSPPAPFKAGINRTQGDIFLDIESVEREEWLIFFVHELAHYIDSDMHTSALLFGDEDTTQKIAVLADIVSGSLISSDQKILSNWIGHGLNAGLLAEYRAWAATVLLYREGVGQVFRRVAWMDELSQYLGLAKDPWIPLLNDLNQRAYDPKDGLLGMPLIQEHLKLERNLLLEKPPKIGIFSQIFGDVLN